MHHITITTEEFTAERAGASHSRSEQHQGGGVVESNHMTRVVEFMHMRHQAVVRVGQQVHDWPASPTASGWSAGGSTADSEAGAGGRRDRSVEAVGMSTIGDVIQPREDRK